MLFFYNAFIRLYGAAIQLAAGWNKKAATWLEGRRDVFAELEKHFSPNDKVIWVHCSSAGEFEQGKPVIEALKKDYPQKKILVSFFSPSGLSVAKNYAHADVITYLPLDTPGNARRFYQAVKPELVIFVKYEFWYHHLAVIAFHHVPILLISAVFRKEQAFFKPYGKFFRQMLHLFRHIFVQDQSSADLLKENGIAHCSISGDTRFDRVKEIAAHAGEVAFIDSFAAGRKLIVAGSTWPGDEEVLAAYLGQNNEIALVLAPHEINAKHIESVQKLFPGAILYSSLKNEGGGETSINHAQVLIIDSVGLLSRLYRYATITYVGGGFTADGIHNILEAAVWGKPVIFGPNFQKYREGKELIASGGAFHFSTAGELKKIADDLLANENHLQETSLKAKNYIEANTGATQVILNGIQEKRLLTN